MSDQRQDKWGQASAPLDIGDNPTVIAEANHSLSALRKADLSQTLVGIGVQEMRVELERAQALVAPRRRSLPPRSGRMAAMPPRGMATPEQLDSFRELRTRLLAMAAGVDLDPFTTLIVPLRSGSGGSFVARNLAAAFTLEDRLAMLLDCNPRNPTQHLALGSQAEGPGLLDFLDMPHADAEQLVRPSGISGLFWIPAGRPASPLREYFSSQTMRQLLAALREGSCYLFLDGPPAIGSPDARILSQWVDFVILVVSYGRSTADEIAQAASLFDPKKFAGVVLNERVGS